MASKGSVRKEILGTTGQNNCILLPTYSFQYPFALESPFFFAPEDPKYTTSSSKHVIFMPRARLSRFWTSGPKTFHIDIHFLLQQAPSFCISWKSNYHAETEGVESVQSLS